MCAGPLATRPPGDPFRFEFAVTVTLGRQAQAGVKARIAGQCEGHRTQTASDSGDSKWVLLEHAEQNCPRMHRLSARITHVIISSMYDRHGSLEREHESSCRNSVPAQKCKNLLAIEN